MKRPNITPGEWKWQGTKGRPNGVHYLTGANYETVGACLDSNFTDNKANARAIASLPKLLEALEPFASFFKEDLADIGGGTLVAPSLPVQVFKNAKAALIEAGYTLD